MNTEPLPDVNLSTADVHAHLSERGRLEWELATLRAEVAVLRARVRADQTTPQAESDGPTE